MKPSAQRSIAIVVPVYNEEPVLEELFARVKSVMDGATNHSWHIILADDGSRDRSAQLIRNQASRDSRFSLIQLSRNFGFQAALSAGLTEAEFADAIITMDADLQDPPEVIPSLIAAWEKGADIVYAVRETRSETGPRRVAFDLFHRLLGVMADFPIEKNAGTFGLMSQEAVRALNQLPERHRFFPGLRSWVGFTSAEVPYDRKERAAGKPQQTFRRLLLYALDGIFSFSYLPLRILTIAGIFVSAFGFSLGLFFVIRRLLGIEIAQTGFTTLVTLTLFLGGGQLIGIGILGEYLGRIYDEVKQRPTYILKKRR